MKSSGLLRRVRWFDTNVLGLIGSPITSVSNHLTLQCSHHSIHHLHHYIFFSLSSVFSVLSLAAICKGGLIVCGRGRVTFMTFISSLSFTKLQWRLGVKKSEALILMPLINKNPVVHQMKFASAFFILCLHMCV
jgi:hypothetical protein